MSTTFTKQVQPQDGNWIVTFGIASKDPADVTLAQEYGDVEIRLAGGYVDPADSTFSFSIPINRDAIWSNVLLNKLPQAQYMYVFDDASVLAATRYRQAVIFANAVQVAITAALVALRAMPATVPVNTTFVA